MSLSTIVNKRGFSLVEYMIAISIGSILILGVIGIYKSTKTNYKMQEALSRLQENARYSSYFLNKNIRMAGYQGCVTSTNLVLNNIVKNPSSKVLFDNSLVGYEAVGSTWSPALPSYLSSANIKQGTDVLEIRYASSLGLKLSHAMPTENSALVLLDTDGDGDFREGISAGDAIMITDCEVGDIAVVGNNVNANSISISSSQNNTSSLTKAYDTDANIFKFEYLAIYVKDTGRTNRNGDPIFALATQDINGNESIIVDGVENLQLTYGVDTNNDGTADSFLSAATINTNNQWNDVLVVRIDQLLNSIERVSNLGQTYQFNGETLNANDRLLRRHWHSVISIRNRSFP